MVVMRQDDGVRVRRAQTNDSRQGDLEAVGDIQELEAGCGRGQ